MSCIWSIDPGPTESAVISLQDGKFEVREILPNDEVHGLLRGTTIDVAVCEMIASYGMPVGKEVFETCVWIGRFWQACYYANTRFERLYRQEVKLHLCNSVRARDSNIRMAIIDRFGGEDAIGKKHSPGPLYGIKADMWAALAVLITWCDRHEIRVPNC